MDITSFQEFGTYFLDTFISRLSSAIGIFAIVPILATWYEVRIGKKRQHQAWWQEAKQAAGARPAIFIVDLKHKADIRTQVRIAISDSKLNTIPEDRIFHVAREVMHTPRGHA